MEPVKNNPLATALIGIITGAVCFGFVLLAHHSGLALSELTQDGLILGGMASMGVGAYGARHMPTDGGGK
jgi:hypothetical protein